MVHRVVVLAVAVALLLCGPPAFAEEDPMVTKFRESLRPSVAKGAISKGVEPSRREAGELVLQLTFRRDSHVLAPDSVRLLDALGEALQSPDLSRYFYMVEGHTCDMGSEQHNMALSRSRAQTVVDYMVHTYGFPAAQFNVQGYGESRPSASNKTEEGREKNRRVVIVNTAEEFAQNEGSRFRRPEVTISAKYLRGREEKLLQRGDTLTERDHFGVEFSVKAAAYVYVYIFDSSGKVDTLFPNPAFSERTNPVQPGKLYRVPKFGEWLHLDENKGMEHIVVLASNKDILDPANLCTNLLEEESHTYASATQPSSGTAQVERGLGGKRSQEEITPSGTSPSPQQVSLKPDKKPRDRPNPSGVFTWKLSFHHQ